MYWSHVGTPVITALLGRRGTGGRRRARRRRRGRACSGVARCASTSCESCGELALQVDRGTGIGSRRECSTLRSFCRREPSTGDEASLSCATACAEVARSRVDESGDRSGPRECATCDGRDIGRTMRDARFTSGVSTCDEDRRRRGSRDRVQLEASYFGVDEARWAPSRPPALTGPMTASNGYAAAEVVCPCSTAAVTISTHASRSTSSRRVCRSPRSPNMSWKIDWVRASRWVEDLAALGAEGVGLVEDRGDAALLVERWEWDRRALQDAR